MDALTVNPSTISEMQRFHEITDGAAIIVNKHGIYRQTKLYRRGFEVYAGVGAGFIRLLSDGNTSSPHTRHVGIDSAGLILGQDRVGKLVVEGNDG